MKTFHRLFRCRLCKRVIAGCISCDAAWVEEFIDACAYCGRK